MVDNTTEKHINEARNAQTHNAAAQKRKMSIEYDFPSSQKPADEDSI